MRLLNTQVSDRGKFAIQEFTDYELPPYAILSHTWSKEEVTYQEINAAGAKKKSGYDKITQCCSVARASGYEYVWIDTCCIDKTSSAELSEAINSMYQWYQKAEICYAYLADIRSEGEIAKSKWLTRGWTLQELIAPSRVVFLNEEWRMLGDKAHLQDKIAEYTGIPPSILSGEEDLETSSVAQRMSWAAKRQTSRVEDRAYSLMGIFSVNMPLIYGEGENAFIRLQEEIMRISDDQSLFAWGSSDDRGGLLATSPDAFAHSYDIVRSNPFGTLDNPFTVSSRGVQLDLGFRGIGGGGLGLAILSCARKTRQDNLIAIYLRDLSLSMNLFKRVQSRYLKEIDPRTFRPAQYPVRRLVVQGGRKMLIQKRITVEQACISQEQVYLVDELRPPEQPRQPAALLTDARTGDVDGVWLLLTQSDVKIDMTDQNSRTPLLLAAKNGHEKIKGAATENENLGSWTPLLMAAEKGHEGIIKMLLERGAATETKNRDGRTPLSIASAKGHEGIVNILLEKGAATEIQKSGSRTPLSLAAENGHKGIRRCN
ncbi:uncharacterized protein BO96DRAFT_432262 [Aspergillus niger CBS 101883]|uniref:uncharacterized protein n=1 Tax=Aspergillus lacticoffeatus (strain CBS 101883) TaxID=1450533 RepID=UPI000D805B6C|nr:uncharacterized protein BO96DRAFT_432262 [Aspergillus niger CBS 101883]PYH58326.1 hypothetical protein BO96DRAFT_432262 [Aspergillus niger CBS 101883]